MANINAPPQPIAQIIADNRSFTHIHICRSLASVSRPALGPTQHPVQWVPGVLSPGVKRGRGLMLTTHPHLMPRS
jgi:hypothetical protein